MGCGAKMIIENCPDAEMCETLSSFHGLVASDMIDGVIEFKSIQQRRYMKFWQNLCISRLVDTDGNYEIVLWGSELTKRYGKDLTGTRVRPEDLGTDYEVVSWHHYKTIKHNDMSYLSGTLGWQDRDHIKWRQIFVPMLKNGDICCLSVICFD
jgi:hypothetical protein